jgi:putative membrane protein
MVILKRFITGVLMGIATWVSVGGGTIAIILGIYDDLLAAVTINIKKLMRALPLLLPVIGGMVIGIGISAVLISNFLDVCFPVPTKMFFFGIVLGSIPIFCKEGTKTEKLKPLDIFPFLIGAAAIVLLWLYQLRSEGAAAITESAGLQSGFTAINIIKLALGGIITAAAMVLPGLSGSAMMLVLGIYYLLTDAIAHPFDNLPVLGIFIVFCLIGIFLSAKPISWLLANKRKVTYCVIGGFVIGSLPSLFPYAEFTWGVQGIVGIIIMIIALPLPVLMEKTAN